MRRCGSTRATATADALIDRFADAEGGGFFTTASDGEQLIVRTKDVFDGATPSANAVAALALARLGALTGVAAYTAHARRVVDLIGELLTRHPTAFAHTVLTADLLARGCTEVVVTGDRPDLVAEYRSGWRPEAVVAWGEPTDSPLWSGRAPAWPMSAATTRAGSRPPTPPPWPVSSPDPPGRQVGVMAARSARTPRSGTARDVARAVKHRDQIAVEGGTSLTLLVLACHEEDTTGVDLASGALVRVRVDWPAEHGPDLAPFDVVETQLADEPERDDLAQPEAVTATGLPRHLGTLHGRKVRHLLHQLAAPVEDHVLGFPGASAPYWEFKGFRPSLALIEPTKGPVLFRRIGDRTAWVRFGWGRSDNWLPVEDPQLERALDVARRDRLQGKDLASALGFKPHYLVAAVSTPRDGHCYKTVRALLPRS